MLKKLPKISALFLLFISPLIAVAQPANDNCADAIAIGSVTDLAFTNIDATTDGPATPDGCTTGGDTPDSLYNDVWYLFTADFTGLAELSLCSTVDFDSKIAVYQPGSPCPPTIDDHIACNEDGPGCDNFTSSVTFDVISGEVYLLRLGGWGTSTGTESGSGTFSVGEFNPNSGPVNQNCPDAIILTLDDNDSTFVEFTTAGANTSPPMYEETFECFDVPNNETTVFNDIWYSFTSPFTGFMEWSNCGTSTFDSRMAVYGPDQPCPPDPFALVGCSDDGVDANGVNCGGFTSRSLFPVEQGATYLLNLGGWSSSNAGTGTFILKRTDPPIPPANDLCAAYDTAWVITEMQADDFDVLFAGFTLNATQDVVANPFCRPSGEFWDVWYKFDSGTNTELNLRFNKVNENSQFIIDLYDNCTQQTLAANGGFCVRTDGFPDAFIDVPLSGFPGVSTEYFIRVSTRITTDQPGEFWFQLVGDPVSSVKELNLDRFKFYPNPVTNQLNVDFISAKAGTAQIEILNTLGQQVHALQQTQLLAGQNNLNFELAQLQTGIYFFRIQTEDGQKTVKFIKK